MEQIEHTLKIKVLKSKEDYPSYLTELIDLSKDQLERSYAPYSKFNVGAALICEDGSIYQGCNQENASYPLCICAERVALYNAGASTNQKIKAIAVVARNSKQEILKPVSPCGACRQVILEFEKKQEQAIEIFLIGPDELVFQIDSAAALLPISFNKKDLI